MINMVLVFLTSVFFLSPPSPFVSPRVLGDREEGVTAPWKMFSVK